VFGSGDCAVNGNTDDIQVNPPDRLVSFGREYACAIGAAGASMDKREGDRTTPVGRFPLRRVYYRPDRLPEPKTNLPVQALGPDDGWCDDPDHADYNRPVALPHPARHEKMWRDDGLYDVVVVLGHNDAPPTPGLGSAIFLHVAAESYPPTEGCIALKLADLLDILEGCGPGTAINISPA